ncbi:MAG: bifunctional phosphoribosyl-AMP cyclohydrolase/phosphoribosyl-ATP diphosphatase HisIE, partial [Candidatus Diapherotrites archaeon]|nr:bifunctional phosphoribosyl-AMP cyclohydrolase/phosphoribosyl-ATP diphosphatase HisIE [Candidatus Diapherotrites archaeon]
LKKAIGKDKIIVALDSKKGKISINGWTKELQETTLERAKKLERYCSEFLYTCIDREGKMNGIDWKTIQELKKTTKNQLTVAGGISKISEIKKLEKQNINSVLGMALYANQVNLSKFIIPLLDFKKQKLIPTIVQEESTREVLMLAYSNAESLEQVWKTEKAWYWSRKWNRLWMKGEKSGNIQKIKKVEFDCDQDTILFTVEQTGTRACHKNTETCFGNRKPNSTFLNQLEKIIYTRKNVRTKTSSYTKKLFENPVLLRKKLREEINEVIEADQKQDRNNMVWELADIQYFLTVMAAKNNVSIKEVGKELAGRNK